MRDPSSPFPRLWAPPPIAAALWLAAPVLALLAYGWGPPLALPLAGWISWESRARRPASVGSLIGLLLGLAGFALVDVELLANPDRALPRLIVGWVSLLLLASALRALFTRLGVRALGDDPEADRGDPRARASRVADLFGASTAGAALGSVFSDEPLLPLTVGYAALSAALWIHSARQSLAVEERADALLAGRDPAFEATGDAEHGALVFSRSQGVPFRAPDPMVARAVLAPWPRGSGPLERSARIGVVTAALTCAAVLSHADLSPSDRAHVRRARLWVVQRPVPPAIRARFPRHRGFTRLEEVTIPGASVWQDCRWPACAGAVVVVDDASGQILEAPAAMRRVRDRAPAHLARTRLGLTRLYADEEVGGVLACGDVLVVRSSTPLALDLSRGDIVDLRGATPGCDAARRALGLSPR